MLGKSFIQRKMIENTTNSIMSILGEFDGSRTLDSITKKEVKVIVKRHLKEAIEKASK